MLLRWIGERPYADREALAALYEVSARTIRRHCHPADRMPRAGLPRGLSGVVFYDALDAAEQLDGIARRPDRTARRLHQQGRAAA